MWNPVLDLFVSTRNCIMVSSRRERSRVWTVRMCVMNCMWRQDLQHVLSVKRSSNLNDYLCRQDRCNELPMQR
jgi:hypothetical protein